jgi:hypothetical protein
MHVNPDETYGRWRDWLGEPGEERIWDDIFPMVASRQMWERYIEIVQANPKIQTPGNFHQWARANYVVSQCLAIRRQVDPDTRTASMRRLLYEIALRPEVLSRERYVSLYAHLDLDLGERDWQSQMGTADHIDPSVPREDLRNLLELAKPVVRLVNKRIAHRDLEAFENDLTFERMNECIDLLVDLYAKYALFVTATSTAKTVSQPAWDSIFRLPWIDSG